MQSYKLGDSDKKTNDQNNGARVTSKQPELGDAAEEFSGLLRQIDNSCYGANSHNHYTSIKRNKTSKNSSTVNMFPFGSIVIHDQHDDNTLNLNTHNGQFSTMAIPPKSIKEDT